jgi:hypothetical protein
MSKVKLKARASAVQGGVCELSKTELPINPSLFDTDRRNPKADGGIYTDANTRAVEPRAHMARHGTLRTRAEQLEELKSTFDDRVQTMKLMLKVNNQVLAYERRTDHMNQSTMDFLKQQLIPFELRLAEIDKSMTKLIKKYDDPLSQAALKVKGFGPITVTALAVYVDIAKADYASSLWKYVGLDKASHERYTKGEAGGGNKTLRTVLWNTANVMMKLKDSPYRLVYDQVKNRLSVSEKVTKTRNTQGHLVEAMWKDTKPSHRHGAALRAVVKHLLSDYWYIGRELAGLPTAPLYVESYLGHTSIVKPRERGWS